jgi:hypothetical protein
MRAARSGPIYRLKGGMVDQNSAGWNRIADWLRRLEVLRDAA